MPLNFDQAEQKVNVDFDIKADIRLQRPSTRGRALDAGLGKGGEAKLGVSC